MGPVEVLISFWSGLRRLFLRSNWEYAYHYNLIIYVNKPMCSPHVCIDTNMWWAPGFVYINNEIIMICILPVRAKKQPLRLTIPLGPASPTWTCESLDSQVPINSYTIQGYYNRKQCATECAPSHCQVLLKFKAATQECFCKRKLSKNSWHIQIHTKLYRCLWLSSAWNICHFRIFVLPTCARKVFSEMWQNNIFQNPWVKIQTSPGRGLRLG